MKTNVYVDGFNLYYGSVRGTPYRWLDVRAMCSGLLPRSTINRVHYFTALVDSRPDDPDKPVRQLAYWRALATTGVEIHRGHFLTNPKLMRLVTPLPDGTASLEVWKTEEKGSDVNLATRLLCDGYEGDYEAAAIISNDSDLAYPMEMVQKKFRVPMLLLHPSRHPNVKLAAQADFVKWIRGKYLRQYQLPPVLIDANGTITKPAAW